MTADLTPQIDPFCRDALGCFREHIGRFLRRDLDIPAVIAGEFTARTVQSLKERGEAGLGVVAEDLCQTGIGARWNRELGTARAAVLARWIAPYAQGSVLDLLCGTGAVAEALAARGLMVIRSEREGGDRRDAVQQRTAFCPLEHLTGRRGGPRYGTVLLCTVLHHEEHPARLLALGARLADRRLIIVENCIERRYPAAYQLLMDVFFNRCLNPSDYSSPGHHRSAAQWAGAFGGLIHVARKPRLPGIPLSHHMIVLDVSVSRGSSPGGHRAR